MGLLTVISMYHRVVEVMKPQSARVNSEFRAKAGATDAKVGDRLPGADLEACVVAAPRASSQRSVTLVWLAGRSVRGSLGRTERMEEWVEEKVYGCVPHGMVAVDVEELAAGAVKAVGIDGRAARTQEGSRCADVGRRGGE